MSARIKRGHAPADPGDGVRVPVGRPWLRGAAHRLARARARH